MADMPGDRHLGDGCYVSFDGYQLWLAANDHRNRVVALEPGVFNSLVSYAGEINRAAGRAYFGVPALAAMQTDSLVRQIARMSLTEEADGVDLGNDGAMDGLIRLARTIVNG